MAITTYDQFRELQEAGAGDAWALARSDYSSQILTAYSTTEVFGQYIKKETLATGTSNKDFYATAKADAHTHTPGAVLTGSNQPHKIKRNVALNGKEIVSEDYYPDIDQWVSHLDTRTTMAVEHSNACSRKVDMQIGRMISLGARVPGSGSGSDSFLGGKQLTAADSGAITAAYPRSLVGSRKLQAKLAELRVYWLNQGIPGFDMSWIAFLPITLTDVLAQDNTLMSYDYQTVNDRLTRKLVRCEGFYIQPVPDDRMPSAVVTAADELDDGDARYIGDFSKTIGLFTAGSEAVAQVVAGGGIRSLGPDFIPERKSTLVGAQILHGCNYLRPELCGELVLQ